jgi:hypothetical protein
MVIDTLSITRSRNSRLRSRSSSARTRSVTSMIEHSRAVLL